MNIATVTKPKENICLNAVWNITHKKDMERKRKEKEDQGNYKLQLQSIHPWPKKLDLQNVPKQKEPINFDRICNTINVRAARMADYTKPFDHLDVEQGSN